MEKQKASSGHRPEKQAGRSLPSFSRSGLLLIVSADCGCASILNSPGVEIPSRGVEGIYDRHQKQEQTKVDVHHQFILTQRRHLVSRSEHSKLTNPLLDPWLPNEVSGSRKAT